MKVKDTRIGIGIGICLPFEVGFTKILSGELDTLPEQAFYLVGNLDEVVQKAESL